MSNSNRRPNQNFGNRNFGSSYSKNTINFNRSRPSGGGNNVNNFSNNNTRNQVSPWLSSNSLLGSTLGRNLPNEHLALATRLLNNLLSPDLTNLAQPRPLLGTGRTTNTSPFTNDSSGFNRNRFGQGRPNSGGGQKNFKRDFKNKHFGIDRNSKKKGQSQNNKKSTDEKIAEKKEVVSNEGVKVEKMDIEQSASEKLIEVKVETDSVKASDEQKKEERKLAPEVPKMTYDNIPAALLFCHICRKHMWDDTSFKKHLEGRPHMLMVEELDQSYKMKVELLRHEMRVMEQQRENDVQRSQRKGKNNILLQQRDFCTMCNLNFLGTLPVHRKNERHQKLKKFLHPKCNICSEEFYTRLEWDDHKLSPGHLKKLAEIRKERRPELEDTEFDIVDFIEEMNDALDVEDIELKVVGKRETLENLQSGKTASSQDKDNDKDEKVEEEDEKAFPKYNAGTPVGEDFVCEIKGSLCRVCHKFLMTPEDIKIHCQTAVHYNNTIKVLKMQNNFNRKRRVNKVKVEKEEATVDGDSISEEISCKRPKIEELSVESTNEVRTTESNDDKYDPELSGDDENETNTTVFDSEIKTIAEDENRIQDISVVIDKLINGTGEIPEVDIKAGNNPVKVEEKPVTDESIEDEKLCVAEPKKVGEKQAKAPQSVKTDKQTRASSRAQRARRGRGRRF